MIINYHLFVFIATVIFYFILKSYKAQKKKKSSNLVYLLAFPICLYLVYYFYIYKDGTITQEPIILSPPSIQPSLPKLSTKSSLSEIFPDTSLSS